MDIVIDRLLVEEDRPAHIAKHNVTIDEVVEVVTGDYVFIQGKHGRWLLIGPTQLGRFLTVVVGERAQKNTYGLVTARSASKAERNFYKEFTLELGGEEHDENRKS